MGEVVDQPVDGEQLLAPRARRLELGPLPQPAVVPDHGRDAVELLEHPVIHRDDFVVRLGEVAVDAVPRGRQLDREVAARDGAQRVEQLPFGLVGPQGRGGAVASRVSGPVLVGGALSVGLGFSGDGRRRHTRSPRAREMTKRRRRSFPRGKSIGTDGTRQLLRASYPSAARAKQHITSDSAHLAKGRSEV